MRLSLTIITCVLRRPLLPRHDRSSETEYERLEGRSGGGFGGGLGLQIRLELNISTEAFHLKTQGSDLSASKLCSVTGLSPEKRKTYPPLTRGLKQQAGLCYIHAPRQERQKTGNAFTWVVSKTTAGPESSSCGLHIRKTTAYLLKAQTNHIPTSYTA